MTQKMSERSILFKPEMVRAILNTDWCLCIPMPRDYNIPSKWETRRPITRLKGFGAITEFQKTESPGYDFIFRNKRMLWNDVKSTRVLECCPYGKIGDKLWVRETFYQNPTNNKIFYRADDIHALDGLWFGWKPSIFMPRKLSRLTLEIINIRIERLQSISKPDISAEGFRALDDFKRGWDGINQKRGFGWNKNPWVFVDRKSVV